MQSAPIKSGFAADTAEVSPVKMAVKLVETRCMQVRKVDPRAQFKIAEIRDAKAWFKNVQTRATVRRGGGYLRRAV